MDVSGWEGGIEWRRWVYSGVCISSRARLWTTTTMLTLYVILGGFNPPRRSLYPRHLTTLTPWKMCQTVKRLISGSRLTIFDQVNQFVSISSLKVSIQTSPESRLEHLYCDWGECLSICEFQWSCPSPGLLTNAILSVKIDNEWDKRKSFAAKIE